jgi:hypothetical protein
VRAAQEVGERAGDLDTGEAAADHDEMAEAAAQRGIGLELDAGDPLQHPVADEHRIADQLQRQGMLGEPGTRSVLARVPKASTRCS